MPLSGPCLLAGGEARHVDGLVRGQPHERLLRALEIAEHRVAEDVVASAALGVSLTAGSSTGSIRPAASVAGSFRFTSRSGSGTGSGRSRIGSASEKIATLTPMPSASVNATTAVNVFCRLSVRSA